MAHRPLGDRDAQQPGTGRVEARRVDDPRRLASEVCVERCEGSGEGAGHGCAADDDANPIGRGDRAARHLERHRHERGGWRIGVAEGRASEPQAVRRILRQEEARGRGNPGSRPRLDDVEHVDGNGLFGRPGRIARVGGDDRETVGVLDLVVGRRREPHLPFHRIDRDESGIVRERRLERIGDRVARSIVGIGRPGQEGHGRHRGVFLNRPREPSHEHRREKVQLGDHRREVAGRADVGSAARPDRSLDRDGRVVVPQRVASGAAVERARECHARPGHHEGVVGGTADDRFDRVGGMNGGVAGLARRRDRHASQPHLQGRGHGGEVHRVASARENGLGHGVRTVVVGKCVAVVAVAARKRVAAAAAGEQVVLVGARERVVARPAVEPDRQPASRERVVPRTTDNVPQIDDASGPSRRSTDRGVDLAGEVNGHGCRPARVVERVEIGELVSGHAAAVENAREGGAVGDPEPVGQCRTPHTVDACRKDGRHTAAADRGDDRVAHVEGAAGRHA